MGSRNPNLKMSLKTDSPTTRLTGIGTESRLLLSGLSTKTKLSKALHTPSSQLSLSSSKLQTSSAASLKTAGSLSLSSSLLSRKSTSLLHGKSTLNTSGGTVSTKDLRTQIPSKQKDENDRQKTKLNTSLKSTLSSSDPSKVNLGISNTAPRSKVSLLSNLSIKPSRLGVSSISTLSKTSKLRITSTSSLTKSSQLTALNAKQKPSKSENRLSETTTHSAGGKFIFHSEFSSQDYDFKIEDDDREVDIPEFVSPDADVEVHKCPNPVKQVTVVKTSFINGVSASLLGNPDFHDPKDGTRKHLMDLVDQVISYDPEFVLKVALYARCELNIRTTADFLLALASHRHSCRPFLKKYFNASVRLPSDWIDVAEVYLTFHDKTINFGALPSALRKAMMTKFPEFDAYQLAKYNKDKKKKKDGDAKKKKIKDDKESSDEETEETGNISRQLSYLSEQSENEEELTRLTFTLKQLIRKLHITTPVENVMCLIGKRYPGDDESFRKSGLPGEWNPERSGKRMKLATPETWETQVSMKGNKASTWEDLIDHNKLPFMAMLRNLRNMLQAGISDRHHAWVLRKLTSEKSVINSKQFPFRFFSAYEVLVGLEKALERQEALAGEDMAEPGSLGQASWAGRGFGRGRGRGRGQGRGRGRGAGSAGRGYAKKIKAAGDVKYSKKLLTKYRKALDTAVKIATCYNVKPIPGTTVLFCNVGSNMNRPCTSAKAFGKPKTVLEVGTLLGLMCKYSCEECEMIACGPGDNRKSVELERGTILDNMQKVLEYAKEFEMMTSRGSLPLDILRDLLRDRVQIDNLIILSDGMKMDGNEEGLAVLDFLKKYRHLVNPNLLFVNVDLSGAKAGFSKTQDSNHPNDVYIAGYSDQILSFIAGRGDAGQLAHVEKIDEAFQLRPMQTAAVGKGVPPLAPPSDNNVLPEKPLPMTTATPRWRTAKVFISSTFRDMHSERDLLTRFVFPELRARAKKHFINVYEVDLRWGVTEEEARSNKSIEICLGEVARCDFFIGILGERYGWIPDRYVGPDTDEFDWLEDYPGGRSITELEIQHAALCDPRNAVDNAFIYLRDNQFIRSVPSKYRADLEAESNSSREKINSLKERLRKSGLEVFDSYPCEYTGKAVDGVPVLGGLEQFGARVLNNLWNAILKKFPDQDVVEDEIAHDALLHEACIENHLQTFVGRKAALKQCLEAIENCKHGMVVIHGKAGSGKSALMAALTSKCTEKLSDTNHVIAHFIGAVPGSTNIVSMLKRICCELQRRFRLSVEIPADFKNLTTQFSDILKEAAMYSGSLPIVLCIDGLDLLEDIHQAKNMDWLPTLLPEGVKLVMSCVDDGDCHKALLRRNVTGVSVGALDMWDKADMVRKALAAHRKTLDESPFNNQLKLLLSKREAGIPLYLSLACEELRVFGVFEKVSQRIKMMAQTVTALLQEVMARLEDDHGKRLVATSLSLLVCVRDGLLEDELHALLSLSEMMADSKYQYEDIINIQLSADQYLPRANFARLIRGLQTFLRPLGDHNTGRLSLAHSEIEKSIRQRYMKIAGADYEVMLHTLIAGYFHSDADPRRNASWSGKKPRPFSELPYHIACAGAYRQLETVLCSLTFIKSKCMMGMAGQLMEDFIGQGNNVSKMALREQEKFLSKTNVKAFRSFVSRNLHILSRYPVLTLQQAMNEPSDTIPAKMATDMIDSLTGVNQKMVVWSNKHEEEDPCAMTLSGQSDTVTCVAVAADNSVFAIGTQDCTLKLFDLITGKEVMSFTGHSGSISDCCFTGKNNLCSASWDGTLSLWSVKDGHRIAVMKGHTRRVNSCSANLQGTSIVSASWDCTIRVWNAADGRQITDICGDKRPVNCVSFHPDGQKIVTGSWDTTMKIWDTYNKKRLAVLRGHKTAVRDCTFSPSGRHIASAALDGDVKLWSAQTGSQVGSISGHSLPINKLTFSPSGDQLITVSDDHKVKVWSGHLGRSIQCLGNNDFPSANCVAIDPSGTQVVIGYQDECTRKFDLATGAERWAVKHHTMRVRCTVWCSTDNTEDSMIITGSEDSSVKVLSAENGDLVYTLVGYRKPVMSVSYNHNTRLIAATSEDTLVYLWRMPMSFAAEDDVRETELKPIVSLVGSNSGSVSCCSFNSDGTKLVTATRDAMMMVWSVSYSDLQGKTEISPARTFHACHQDWINDCAWSDLGDAVVTASNDFTLKVWDMVSGKEKVKLVGHTSAINSVAFKHGCIVSACYDGTVKVWSHKGAEITTLSGHSGRVNGCDIFVTAQNNGTKETSSWAAEVEEEEKKNEDADKKIISLDDVVVTTASDDGTVKIWKPLVGNEIASLTGHSDRVLGVAMTRDGQQIITTSMDKSIKLWSPNLKTCSTFASHDAEVTCVVYSTDGSMVLSASRNGHLVIWKFTETGEGTLCVPEKLVSQKVSEKSINTATFLSQSKFLTGGDDGSITTWLIDRTDITGRTIWFIREVSKIVGSEPVTSIAVNSYRNEFTVASWKPEVVTYSTTNSKFIRAFKSTLPDWILKVKYASNFSTLVAIATNGRMELFQKTGRENVKMDQSVDSEKPKWLHSVESVNLSDGDLSSICGSGYGSAIITGDSNGCVSVYHLEDKRVCYHKKIHSDQISGIAVSNGIIATSSHDSTLKIWKSNDFTQIGQFFCQSPVTSLARSPKTASNKFICGDTLGNLYFLQWQA